MPPTSASNNLMEMNFLSSNMDFSLGQLETGSEIKINQITAGPRLPRSETLSLCPIHHLMPASTPETAEMLSAYYPRRPAQRPMGFTKSLVLKTGVGCCTWHSGSRKPVSAPSGSSGFALDWGQWSAYRDCKKLSQVPPNPSRVRNPYLNDSG